MTLDSRLSTEFKSSDFLYGIKDKDLENILNQGSMVRLKTDEILFRQGDPALCCHLVLNGRLKLVKLHEQGREAIIRYIDPNQVTAATAMFRKNEYPVTAVAVCPTEVVSWGKDTMIQLIFHYPGLSLNLIQVAIDRLEDIQTRYLELLSEQVDRRIARTLLRLMKHGGVKTDAGIEIGFPMSRQELSDYAGTTLYTVSRTLSAWEKKGWIKSGREKITIVDAHALVLFSESG